MWCLYVCVCMCLRRDWQRPRETDMHIDLLPITFLPIDNGRDQHECVLGHEVSYASFPARVCCQVEFESRGERQEGEGEESMAEGNAHHYWQGIDVYQSTFNRGLYSFVAQETLSKFWQL